MEMEFVDLPKVPQVVSDWFELNKEELESNVKSLIRNAEDDAYLYKFSSRQALYNWLANDDNHPVETLFKMQGGYQVDADEWIVRSDKLVFTGWGEDGTIAQFAPDCIIGQQRSEAAILSKEDAKEYAEMFGMSYERFTDTFNSKNLSQKP